MYQYDAFDQAFIDARVEEFRDQTQRYLAGELTEDEFRPLRLQNGLYIQRHAPMFRIGVPYGLLSSKQVRTLAAVARKYDRGYGHFSTRQNFQLNWITVGDVPEALADLAKAQMHAIQTSGGCIRAVTADHLAGVSADESVDPRPFAEILRQWSSLHPEYALLPRKFKFGLTGASTDRAASMIHDVGLAFYRDEAGEIKIRVRVGGGLGRTPVIAVTLNDALPWQELINYSEAILRVYNRYGRRDNLYKSRIKILARSLGAARLREQVETEWREHIGGPSTLTEEELARVSAGFALPPYEIIEDETASLAQVNRYRGGHPDYSRWLDRSVHAHKRPGYRAVTISLKRNGIPPGNITSDELELVAALADKYSFGQVRSTHQQNLVLGDVRVDDLFPFWKEASKAGLANPNTGLLTDMIVCPGGDLCGLANARSTPLALALQEKFQSLDRQFELGPIELNVSGCINSCSHHHIANIGLLGVDKEGSDIDWYQIALGGRQGFDARIADIIGRALPAADIPDSIEKILRFYTKTREKDERFIDTFDRIGIEPFKTLIYGDK